MAGTIDFEYREHLAVKRVKMNWVSDASGDVNGIPTKDISGYPVRVVFIPDSGGTQPDNSYDVELQDQEGQDVLAGAGADLSNSGNSQFSLLQTTFDFQGFSGELDLVVTNAGASNGGTVVFYWR